MIILMWFFLGLHVLFYLALAIRWRKIKLTELRSNSTPISIIIPVRNEEQQIQKLLTCLEHQEYQKDQFEVIVIDDFSEDNTREVVKDLQGSFSMNLRLVALKDPQKSGKKRALTLGVEHATYNFILTTDADCQMGPYWLSSFSARIDENKFIAGPVALKGKGIFSKIQQTEFVGLLGFGAVTLESSNPSMCSGANLGFDKSAFFEVGGYENNLNIPSGDDEFLLYNIQRRFPGKTIFLKNRYAIVVTKTHARFSGFINQRIRWTSKWKYNKNLRLKLIAIWFFFDHFIFLLLLTLVLISAFPLTLFLIFMLVRGLSNLVYISPLQKFIGNNKWELSLFLIQIFYPFHVILMGVTSIFGRYTWKGRKY